jgi:PAS domain S-box-containing protein
MAKRTSQPVDGRQHPETPPARALLEHPAAHLAAIVKSADDAIYSTTIDGTITSWNRAAERMFGYPAEEAIGSPISIIIPGENPHEGLDIPNRIRRGETIDHIETEKVARDGQHVPVSLTLSPIIDARGRIVGISRIARDISERKRVERERELAMVREADARETAEQASRLKDEFLAAVSHELRTPLNAILGWTRMLRQGTLTNESVPKAMETIERNARIQAQLIEDLLDVSSMVSGRLSMHVSTVNLREIVLAAVEVVKDSAGSKEIELSAELPDEAVMTTGDAARLQQAVWNLLANAIKFTDRHGWIEVVLRATADRATIIVRDNGVGVPLGELPHIWDRFRKADGRVASAHGGLGLGLTIVAHVIEAHGGTSRASSAGPGRGATFELTLPVRGRSRAGRGVADLSTRVPAG